MNSITAIIYLLFIKQQYARTASFFVHIEAPIPQGFMSFPESVQDSHFVFVIWKNIFHEKFEEFVYEIETEN